MEEPRSQFITTRNKTIVLASFSFVMFYVFSYMLDPYDVWWSKYYNRPFTELLAEWVLSLTFCILISVSSIFIHEKLNNFLPWIERPLSRLLIETSLNIACVVLLILIQVLFITSLIENSSDPVTEYERTVGYWQWITVSIFIALIISSIHTGAYLITNWKNAALELTEHRLETAQHQQAATEAELQALKLQLDPHFVFNNLSVLSELILKDQQLGYNYSENFAKVYRYLLLNSKKDLITLDDEMKFLKAYMFLLKNRAGDGIEFEIDIDTVYLKLHLPPMTLQLLIENAMKHNKFLKSNPLKICVKSGPNTDLIVSNTLLPLDKKQVSSGLGLQNIAQRYQLLSDRAPRITVNESLFTVAIPLIKP